MSDTFDPEDYGLSPITEQVPRNWRRQLEARVQEAEERAAKAEARNEELERNSVFNAAGIPVDGIGAVLRRGYDGDLTVEAVRTALLPALGQQNQLELQQSLAGHQQAAAMAAGATPAPLSNTQSELDSARFDARRKRNANDAHTQRQRIGQITNREGVEPKPSGWILPKQLQQIQ